MKDKKISHLFLSSLRHESRLEKEIMVSSDLGYSNIEAIGISDEVGYNGHNYTPILFRSLYSRLGKPKIPVVKEVLIISAFLGYLTKGVRYSLNSRIVVIHNWEILVTTPFFKLIGKTVFYHPHELESQKAGKSKNYNHAALITERTLIRLVDNVIVVSPPISDYYRRVVFKRDYGVVRNIPTESLVRISEGCGIKDFFGIKSDEFLAVYVGNISGLRGINDLLDIFSNNNKKHIAFVGYGELRNKVIEYANTYKNIHYHKPVDRSELVRLISDADVGISWIAEDWGLSYRYSLSNKFSDYIFAGLPILSSDNLEYVSELIRRNELGFQIGSNINDLYKFVLNIELEDCKKLKANIESFKENWNWDTDRMVLEEAYIKI